MRKVAAAALVMAFSCRPPESAGRADIDASAPVAPASGGAVGSAAPGDPAKCPAAYGAPGPSCSDARAQALACNYPQGDCRCGAEPRCSGVPAPPEPLKWVCAPRRDPCPAAGGPCQGNGECGPFCCGVGVACRNGRWETKFFPCPP
jgi:hypothetical protein